jgi:hypothetical protein
MVAFPARYATVESCTGVVVCKAKGTARNGIRQVARQVASGYRRVLRVRFAAADIDPWEQEIPLAASPCRLGGHRLWLVCQCQSRVLKLYLPTGHHRYCCRRCHQLRYLTQRLSPCERVRLGSARVAASLGADPDDDRVRRPRGMHGATFERRFARWEAYEEQIQLEMLRDFGRMLGRHQRHPGSTRRLRSLAKRVTAAVSSYESAKRGGVRSVR